MHHVLSNIHIMVRLISIEGNIASGKTTLLTRLKQRYETDHRVTFVPEPVSEWEGIRDRSGAGMLAKYYANQQKYAFAFQMMAYISRLSLLRKALRSGAEVIITERSVLTDKYVFAHMLHADGLLEDVEYAIYTRWFDEFLDEMPPPEVVYVRTDPDTCAHRLSVRAREGEVVPLNYLRNVHGRHEDWLMQQKSHMQYRTLTINATPDITKTPHVVDNWLSEIDRFLWPPHACAQTISSFDEEDGHDLAGIRSDEGPAWTLQFDGASRGNPGHCGAGWVILRDGVIVKEGAHYLSPNCTNNWAEYQALIAGLVAVRELGIPSITVEGDSKLVVDQMNDACATRNPSLQVLNQEAKILRRQIGNVLLNHIPRAENKLADSLANQAIDRELKPSGATAGHAQT
jgi:deoxyadenosine/deoxycytidine kinase/ribonuclease HI